MARSYFVQFWAGSRNRFPCVYNCRNGFQFPFRYNWMWSCSQFFFRFGIRSNFFLVSKWSKLLGTVTLEFHGRQKYDSLECMINSFFCWIRTRDFFFVLNNSILVLDENICVYMLQRIYGTRYSLESLIRLENPGNP